MTTKEKILEEIKDINYAYNNCTKYDTIKNLLDDMLDLVNEQPRADVVEVVRCRNCCHSQYDEEHDWYLCYANFCTMHNGDFYCAAGDPKEKTNDKRNI